MATETEFHFDGWTINRLSGEASRNGQRIRLPQQQLRILVELCDHIGEIVTRDHLVKTLWPKGIVDFDNGLNVAMRKLRVALDDVGDAPRYIETLPKLGYRFIGQRLPGEAVAVSVDASVASPRGSRTVLLGALVGLACAILLGWWLGRSDENASVPSTVAAARAPYVPSVRAQEFYLEGLRQRARRDVNGNLLARKALLAALQEDPNYPQAWATYGEVLSGAVIRQMITPAAGVEEARKAARRAIELDPYLVEGLYLLAQIHIEYDKDFAAAKRAFDRAFTITDKSARLWHHFAMWHGHQGNIESSLAALRKARELEPATLLFSGNYAFVLYQARRYQEVFAFLYPILEANPRFAQAHLVVARALAATGDLQGAIEHLNASNEIGAYQSDLGVVYAKMGKREEALREVARIEARAREGFGVAYDLAMIHVALGDLDRGCEHLLAAVTDHSLLVNWMRLEPGLDPLRGRKCYADAERRLYGPK